MPTRSGRVFSLNPFTPTSDTMTTSTSTHDDFIDALTVPSITAILSQLVNRMVTMEARFTRLEVRSIHLEARVPTTRQLMIGE